MPTLEELGIDRLSAAERMELAQAIWDSVHETLGTKPLAEALRVELERRAALADANPEQGKPWEEVLAAAQARWKK